MFNFFFYYNKHRNQAFFSYNNVNAQSLTLCQLDMHMHVHGSLTLVGPIGGVVDHA